MRIFLDVGAHQGETLEAVIDRFDRIYAFEPMPLQYDILRTRFREYGHVHLCKFGLADQTAERDLYGSNENMEATFYPDKELVDSSIVTKCSFVRASTFFETFIEDTDEVIMKLNCEGAEVEIMNDLLDSGEIRKVDHVMIDFDVRKIPSQKSSEAALLARMAAEDFRNYSLSENVMWGETHQERILNWLDGNERPK